MSEPTSSIRAEGLKIYAKKPILKKSTSTVATDSRKRDFKFRNMVKVNLIERVESIEKPDSCIVELSNCNNNSTIEATEKLTASKCDNLTKTPSNVDYRELELGVDKEPEELDFKILWLARAGEWIKVEEILSNRKIIMSLQRDSLNLVKSEGSLWSTIHYAAKDNKWQIIERLVALGSDVNSCSSDSVTPLHVASIYLPNKTPDCEATIRSLLKLGANPHLKGGTKEQTALHLIAGKASFNSLSALNLILEASSDEIRIDADSEGNIALFEAIKASNEGGVQDILKKLTKEQLYFKRIFDGNCAIHLAIKQKDIEILKVIMDSGCNLDLKNDKGQTALHVATENKLEEFVRLLCSSGADPDVLDNENQSPVAVATVKGYQKIMDILSEKFKASVMYRTKDGSTLMHLAASAYNSSAALGFIKKGIPIHMPNKDGVKCIHIASIQGHVEVVKALVSKGANVDSRTKDGFTPLHLGVKFGKYDLVEALLGLGAEVQLKSVKGGQTALHLATKLIDGDDIVELLIRSGADIDAIDDSNETSLHSACKARNVEAVQLLLDDGANIDLQNKFGENILHVCVKESNLELIKVIIHHIVTKRHVGEAKKLINQTNNKGESSLHYAASLGNNKDNIDDESSLLNNNQYGDDDDDNDDYREIIRVLLLNGADSFQSTIDLNQTPVHYCCQSGNTKILQEILSHLDQQSCRLACNKQANLLWTPIFYACFNGHPEIIKMLINQTARIDVFDEQGEPPLHVAVSRGHEQVVDILLEHNAFVNVRNKPGLTPLHIAAKLGYDSMVLKLVTEHGAILDAMTLIKQTPLHLAAESGQLKVCEILLNMGSDLNAIDNLGQTPLHLAAYKNSAEVLRLFLNLKPDLVSLANKNGYTCAHIAALNGCVDTIKELIKFNRETVIKSRIKKSNSTTLHLASENGNAEITKLLLNNGAKADDENSLGETALHLAAKYGHVKVLHTIKSSDWKLCSKLNGLTGLHIASNCGQTEFVAEMLRCRVSGIIRSERSLIEPKSDYGLTPLHLACRNGHEGVVRMLLNSAGVQVDSVSEINQTIPVHLAAQGGHLLVAGLLISRSTDGLTKVDSEGRTALHFASSHGHREMVGLLIGQGSQMNCQDNQGWTPLHYASKHGYLNVVKLLIESGASPTKTCNLGKVPICMAAAAGHKQVLSYLLKKEHDSFELMQDKNFLIDLMSCSKQHLNRPLQEFILVDNTDNQAPIDIAVKLAKCYENLAEKDKDRARDLVIARDFCDQVATDLLTIVASMNLSTELLKSFDGNGEQFLDVLIELNRKDVVSQHSVQRYLSNVWIGNLTWPIWKFVLLFTGFLLFPPLWVAVSCPAGHNYATVPVIKFMSYLVSHVFFIMLLLFTTINPWLPIYKWTNLFPPFHEWLLLFWFCGILSTTLSNPPEKAGFGSIKLVNLFIGFIAIFVHLIGIILPNNLIPYILFTRNQLFAFVLLLSFVELLNFLTFHHLFGPWAVIIQDLVKDMMRFLVIMGIFLIGFTLTVSVIYVPVFEPPIKTTGLTTAANFMSKFEGGAGGGEEGGGNGGEAVNYNSLPSYKRIQLQQQQLLNELTQQHVPSIGIEFQSPLFVFEMLFYSLFGLVEPDLMPPMHSSPSFSKVIMKLVFGIYMMITVIVLINLLIAMMSNTYQRIEARSDIEWKFGRAKLIRNMIRTSPTPSPLILFMGIWIDYYRKWIKEQERKKRAEEIAISAFKKKKAPDDEDNNEIVLKAARIWMSKIDRLNRKQQQQEQEKKVGEMESLAQANQTQQRNKSGSVFQSTGAMKGLQINEVLSWSNVVQKYWESIGVSSEKDKEEVLSEQQAKSSSSNDT